MYEYTRPVTCHVNPAYELNPRILVRAIVHYLKLHVTSSFSALGEKPAIEQQVIS